MEPTSVAARIVECSQRLEKAFGLLTVQGILVANFFDIVLSTELEA